MQDAPRHRALAPLIAVTLAVAYPAAVAIGPAALAGVVVLSALAACSIVIARRPSAGLRLALAATALWLALGLAGAFVFEAHVIHGFVWVLLVLYLLPLPLVPWLYARTFEGPDQDQRQRSRGAEEQGSRDGNGKAAKKETGHP